MPWRLLKHGESLQVGDEVERILNRKWTKLDSYTLTLWLELGHTGKFKETDHPIRRYYRETKNNDTINA